MMLMREARERSIGSRRPHPTFKPKHKRVALLIKQRSFQGPKRRSSLAKAAGQKDTEKKPQLGGPSANLDIHISATQGVAKAEGDLPVSHHSEMEAGWARHDFAKAKIQPLGSKKESTDHNGALESRGRSKFLRNMTRIFFIFLRCSDSLYFYQSLSIY